jgi:hypothetical protein
MRISNIYAPNGSNKECYRAKHVLSLPKGRQARKESFFLLSSPNLDGPFDLAQGMLCAFARVIVFGLGSSAKISNIFG